LGRWGCEFLLNDAPKSLGVWNVKGSLWEKLFQPFSNPEAFSEGVFKRIHHDHIVKKIVIIFLSCYWKVPRLGLVRRPSEVGRLEFSKKRRKYGVPGWGVWSKVGMILPRSDSLLTKLEGPRIIINLGYLKKRA